MEHIDLIFSRSHHLFSYGVRAVTHSPFSHVGVLLDENTVLESTFLLGGVKLATRSAFNSRATTSHVKRLACGNRQAIINAGLTQINKPYDVLALLGIYFHNRHWHDDDKWFCSELIAWMFHEGGTPLFDLEYTSVIVPQHLLMLPSV